MIKADPKKTIAAPFYCPICRRMDKAKGRGLNLLFAFLQERRYRIKFENGSGWQKKHPADMIPTDQSLYGSPMGEDFSRAN